MCGFAGVIAWDDKYRVTRDTLAKMSAAIAHRGPDGEGIYLNHEDQVTPGRPQVGLVHRRLAILDPDPRSNQPFTDGRHWLVFNGEIYNYRELRAELKGLLPNYEWRTNGDTEVLLAGYAAWGEKCVEHLNGMFAIAIWDSVEQSLFLARDRMGQKPLYVQHDSKVIRFASELSALPKVTQVVTHPGLGMADYLRYGCLAVFTPWNDIIQYKPGNTQLHRYGQSTVERSYFLLSQFNAYRIDDSAAVRGTRARLTKAVERQLVSDVPLGVFLSGGIDSSVIAFLARQFGLVKTFSISFDDPRYDESAYSRQVARHLGTEHHEFRVQPHAVTDLPTLARLFGEPFADSSSLPTHYLARETRRHVKVALSGDGGDELFGGYERYKAMQVGQRVKFLNVFKRIAGHLEKGHPKKRSVRAARFIASLDQPDDLRYDGYLRIFSETLLHELLVVKNANYPSRAEAFSMVKDDDTDVVQAALACDRIRYLPDDLLTKVDRCSMLHALEVRSPFMDHELVQFAAGLTTDQLLKGGPKRMLREAFAKDLPDFVFKRKKMGFAVPIGEWFRTDANLKAMLIDHLFATDSFARGHFVMSVVQRLVDEHMSQRVDHSQRLYALLMLELWWKNAACSLQ